MKRSKEWRMGGCNLFHRLDLFSSDSKHRSETPQNHAAMVECCVSEGKNNFRRNKGLLDDIGVLLHPKLCIILCI